MPTLVSNWWAWHTLLARPTPVPGQTYVVQQGDYLFLIAERTYGDGNLYYVIYDANRDVIGPDPTVLAPGQQLFIPLLE